MRLLDRIKALQAKGMTLTEVAFALSPGAAQGELPKPVAWLEYELSHDVIVRVRSGITPWRNRMIQNVLAEAAVKLQGKPKEEK